MSREGGGLVIQPVSVRYAGMERNYEAWNAFLEPFGIEMVNEGLYDPTRPFEGKNQKFQFWSTGNIINHPVTEGVKNLFLPLRNDIYTYPGVPLMKYSPDWQIIVKGEREAQSFKCVIKGEWAVDPARPGTYASEPPVVAVRQFGKGRIVCYPLGDVHTYAQYGMKFWDHVVETRGDGKTPSDSMKLWGNAYRWCAEPALKNSELGTYEQRPYTPVQWPERADWDQFQFEALAPSNGQSWNHRRAYSLFRWQRNGGGIC